MTSSHELCLLSARELAARLKRRSVSAVEVAAAFLGRIAAIDRREGGGTNALCTLVPKQALDRASELDRIGPQPNQPLFGVPIAIKDLVATRGIRTTQGSPLFADQVPSENEGFVDRLEAAGAVILGKTNVPEFGAGSHTFNPVFGTTRNPWNLECSAGGSSGGAAAALAARLLPLADGSDYGGSLRNPASFCGVVGLRPSPGRVPRTVNLDLWDDMAVLGPMARSVEDLALLISVMAGPDERDPISLPEPGSSFQPAAGLRPLDLKGKKIAWTPDLGGRYEIEPEVVAVCQKAALSLEELGATVEEAAPDLSGADDIFHKLRGAFYAGRLAALVDKSSEHQRRDRIKSTVVWNVELGMQLSAVELMQAMHQRAHLLERVRAFFQQYDYLVLPTVQVLPFPAEIEYPTEINGKTLTTYLDWMASCTDITVTRCPAISVPAGFSQDGLPVGLQLVAPNGRDLELLSLALAFEQTQPLYERLPPV